MPSRRVVGCVMLSLGVLLPGTLSAQEFYAGKQIRIVVGSAAGGGYDQYARMLQRYMAKHIPGDPSIIVVNMPGAGGLTGADYIFNIADKDGTVFGAFNRYSAVMPMLGVEQARFKSEQFNWIGTTASYSDNSYVLFVRSDSPHKSAADLRNAKEPVNIGVTGSDVPAILKEALGLNLKIVSGYKASEEVALAFTRKELDAHADGYVSFKATRGEWLEKKQVRIMVQFGRVDRLPELKDVPTARELAPTPDDRALIEFAEAPLRMARPFAAPPNVPAERVRILRAAFIKTMADPAYLKEIKTQNAEHSPLDGEGVQKVVQELLSVSPAVTKRYLKALGGKPPS